MPIQFAAILAGIDAVVSMATKMSEVFRQRSEKAGSQSADDPRQVMRDLRQRVATLEANEAGQYKLIQDMAEAMRALTNDVSIISRRTTITMVVSVTAALLGAAALVVVLATRT
jgi:hypothetical protein